MNWSVEHDLVDGPPDGAFATSVPTGYSTLTLDCGCGYSTGPVPRRTAFELGSRHMAEEHPDEPNPFAQGEP